MKLSNIFNKSMKKNERCDIDIPRGFNSTKYHIRQQSITREHFLSGSFFAAFVTIIIVCAFCCRCCSPIWYQSFVNIHNNRFEREKTDLGKIILPIEIRNRNTLIKSLGSLHFSILFNTDQQRKSFN